MPPKRSQRVTDLVVAVASTATDTDTGAGRIENAAIGVTTHVRNIAAMTRV
jgi:hypothetical protein